MDNELTLERFCVWEEKNSIGPKKKLEINGNNNLNDITKEIKNDFAKKECDDIGKKKTRICSKCGNEKELETNFYIDKRKINNKYVSQCKTCMNDRSKKYNISNKKKIQRYKKLY